MFLSVQKVVTLEEIIICLVLFFFACSSVLSIARLANAVSILLSVQYNQSIQYNVRDEGIF